MGRSWHTSSGRPRWIVRSAPKPAATSLDATPTHSYADRGSSAGSHRLIRRSVSLIVKDRVFKLQLRAGKTEAEARELADAYSGHSLRAGYATTARKR